MCYSLHATVASFALGTHEFLWACFWVLQRSEFPALDRAAVVSVVGAAYFCLFMQITDLHGWLVLLQTKEAVNSYKRVSLRGTEWAAVGTLYLIFWQPIACVAAPTIVAYVADVGWRGVALGVALGVAVPTLLYALALHATLLPAQRRMAGSRHNGLHHSVFDDSQGVVGSAIPPTVVYNAGQIAAAVLQVTVGVLILDGPSQYTWLTFTSLFWGTALLSNVVASPLTASRISSVWCWMVGFSMAAAVAVLITTSDSPHLWWDLNHALGVFITVTITYGVGSIVEQRLAGAHGVGMHAMPLQPVPY